MKSQDNSGGSRRKFLQKFGSMGLGTLAASSLLTQSCNTNIKDIEPGKKITLLNSKNELVEVDSAYISTLNKNLSPNHNSESRKGLPGKKFVLVVDLGKCKTGTEGVSTTPLAIAEGFYLSKKMESLKLIKALLHAAFKLEETLNIKN